MTLAALELNDLSLLIQSEDEARHAEPGFARLTPEGVVAGEEARASAWLDPQNMHNQHWFHLNQSPLAHRHRFARHNADIAYAQLNQLWQAVDAPEELVLLVPGSFGRDRLSLLLGMVEALPARTRAVIDSALAACLDADRDILHVDMMLHESVATVCRPEGPSIRVLDQETFPGVGMVQLQNAVARHISDMLIESHRFDPLHSSATEQAIFDQMPGWLKRLGWEQDVALTLESEKGELPCTLRRDTIKALVGQRLANIVAFAADWPDAQLSLSHGAGVLAGLVDAFAGARIARRTAGTRRVLARQGELPQVGGELYRLRTMNRGEHAGAVDTSAETPLATHLLYGERALPLDRPISIRLADTGPRLRPEVDEGATLTVVRRNRSLETLHGSADAPIPRDCRPGDTILVGGHELRLIQVTDARTD